MTGVSRLGRRIGRVDQGDGVEIGVGRDPETDGPEPAFGPSSNARLRCGIEGGSDHGCVVAETEGTGGTDSCGASSHQRITLSTTFRHHPSFGNAE